MTQAEYEKARAEGDRLVSDAHAAYMRALRMAVALEAMWALVQIFQGMKPKGDQ